jgi:2-polyprenyl-3-methyl-5-hydroxy-6-metoxy-1,4-benzoquinol methylase
MATFENISIKAVEAFWDARPCNIRHSTKEIGTRAYFDEVEARKYRVEPHIPGFAEFDRWHERRVLEVGCGIGTDTIGFARAGARVTAVDLSRKSLEIAERRAKVFGLNERVRFYRADAENLSHVVPVEPHDLVYSFGDPSYAASGRRARRASALPRTWRRS